MKKLRCLIIILGFVGCKNTPSNSILTAADHDKDVLKTSLLGKWGGLGESNPVWKFSSDSLYYYEDEKNYAYNLTGDSITVFYKAGIFVLKDVHIQTDTLYFNQGTGTVKAYRFK